MRKVEVVDYDPGWRDRFEVERRLLAEAVPDALVIEHIGSTSIPGMSAKPIIDLLVVVPDVRAVVDDHAALGRVGYEYRPNVFPDTPEHLFFAKDTDGRRTHHLHVYPATSPGPDDDRLFRDYVMAHRPAADRYAEMKKIMAERHPDSRARYGEAKTPIMVELMAEARRWRSG